MFSLMYRLIILLLLSAPVLAKPLILTSNRPLELFIKEIVQGEAEVRSIVPPNISPHLFELKPSDQVAISKADLLIFVDKNLDNWIVLQSLHLKKNLELINLIQNPLHLKTHFELGDGDHEHLHESLDPHIWLGPLSMLSSIPGIVSEICQFSNCDKIKKQAEIFREKLKMKIEYWRSVLAPLRDEFLMTAHPFLNYFARDLGLKLAPPVEFIPGRETPAKQMIELQKLIKSLHIKYIVSEPTFAKKAISVLSEGTKAKILELDPLGANSNIKSYFDFVDENVSMLTKAYQK